MTSILAVSLIGLFGGFGFLAFLYLCVCVVFGLIAGRIARAKNLGEKNYFWAGFLIGPLAIVVVMLIPSRPAAAPYVR